MTLIIFLGAIGAPEVILIMIALVIFFGGRKIPELMKGLGQGLREFKKASKEDSRELVEKETGKE